MTKTIILGVLAVIVTGGIVGGYYFPKNNPVFGSSPAGSTFSTQKVAQVAVNLASPGSNGTSTSILNTDANDRFITGEEVGCETVGTSKTAYTGTGLASLTLTIATTSTAAPATISNTNTLPVVTIATATPNFVISSSTAGTPGTSIVSNIWASGSYLSFATNATNTALCTIGVRYTAS